MKTVQISLNSIDKVKSFVNDITKFDYDFDLVSGRYVIDAKSIWVSSAWIFLSLSISTFTLRTVLMRFWRFSSLTSSNHTVRATE